MRVVHISTSDVKGGAARAAWRLHCGLAAGGDSSSMLVLRKSSNAATVLAVPVDASSAARRGRKEWKSIHRAWVKENRTDISNTHFSMAAPGCDVSTHPAVQAADVVHLHWVSRCVSPQSVAALCSLGKPVVWTLHDQRAFTGGCHFSAGCDGYERACEACPQLRQDPLGFTRAALADSVAALARLPLTLVTPSRWLRDCALRSAVFRKARVEVIPYGIDTRIFAPGDKMAARARLGLPAGATCFLFGADNMGEKRKGFRLLVESMRLAMEQPGFRGAVEAGRVKFLSFGTARGQSAPEQFPVPVLSFGRIHSEAELARLYGAADVFLLTSLEDNLPNVMLESMACGTPLLANAVGGIPDLVEHEVNGLLVPPVASDFARALTRLAVDAALRERLAARCREPVHTRPLAAQADDYARLYAELLTAAPKCGHPEPAAVACSGITLGAHTAALFPRLLAAAQDRKGGSFLARLWGRTTEAGEAMKAACVTSRSRFRSRP